MIPPKKSPDYGPIDPNLGMDWLSRLSRFRQAETGAPFAAGREITPNAQTAMPIFNPDQEQELRRQAFVRALMSQ